MFTLLITLIGTAQARTIPMGSVQLTDSQDRDTVHLPSCATPQNVLVTALQLTVAQHSADIDRLRVTFHGGGEQVLQVKKTFQPGTTSRWIDLTGGARCVEKIIILGDANVLRRKNHAHVSFSGKAGALAPVVVAPAPKSGVVDLGKVRLTDQTDRDVVNLPQCGASGNQPVDRVRIVVRDHRAEIDRLRIQFHHGGAQVLHLKDVFAAGSESRWVDLQGESRCISKIVIVGDTQSIGRRPGKQALVAFEGSRRTVPVVAAAAASPRPAQAGAAFPLGSIKLGESTERDVLKLAPCGSPGNRPVRSVRLEVRSYPAEINRLKLVFDNGGQETLDVNKVISPGSVPRWRDLPGDARCIDQIIVVGDTQSAGWRPGKQAVLTFFGR